MGLEGNLIYKDVICASVPMAMHQLIDEHGRILPIKFTSGYLNFH